MHDLSGARGYCKLYAVRCFWKGRFEADFSARCWCGRARLWVVNENVPSYLSSMAVIMRQSAECVIFHQALPPVLSVS
jgi:hypothetical protein